ncbi:hypothetical protein F4781DRAFT_417726 [Annulohypoxylon bovei var. microspora]|nr:hypothetical protein F4781DRAFT_417726 [Annulohypoxylon bovei var. microspora]
MGRIRRSLKRFIDSEGFAFIPGPMVDARHSGVLKAALCRGIHPYELTIEHVRNKLEELYRVCNGYRDMINKSGWEKFWSHVKQHVSWAMDEVDVTEKILEEFSQKVAEARERERVLNTNHPKNPIMHDTSLLKVMDQWLDYLHDWQPKRAPYSDLFLPKMTVKSEEADEDSKDQLKDGPDNNVSNLGFGSNDGMAKALDTIKRDYEHQDNEFKETLDKMKSLIVERAENSTVPAFHEWEEKINAEYTRELAEASKRLCRKRKGRESTVDADGDAEGEKTDKPRSSKRVKAKPKNE